MELPKKRFFATNTPNNFTAKTYNRGRSSVHVENLCFTKNDADARASSSLNYQNDNGNTYLVDSSSSSSCGYPYDDGTNSVNCWKDAESVVLADDWNDLGREEEVVEENVNTNWTESTIQARTDHNDIRFLQSLL